MESISTCCESNVSTDDLTGLHTCMECLEHCDVEELGEDGFGPMDYQDHLDRESETYLDKFDP